MGDEDDERRHLEAAGARIITDLAATTARRFGLRFEPCGAGAAEPQPYWECHASVDGRWIGSMDLVELAGEDGSEEAVADLADRLCESFVHDELQAGWPECPEHGRHPLWAVAAAGRAVWACKRDPRIFVEVGRLGA